MKRSTLISAFGLALLLALVLAGQVWAQEPTPSDDEVNAIAHGLYCPVCENIPLDVCPTQACLQWRELIREKLAAGWNETQIKDYFVLQYGDRVLAEPPRRGLNWLVYILPPLIIVGGVVLVVLVLRGMRKPGLSPAPGASAAPPQPPIQDEYLKRLEDELRQRTD